MHLSIDVILQASLQATGHKFSLLQDFLQFVSQVLSGQAFFWSHSTLFVIQVVVQELRQSVDVHKSWQFLAQVLHEDVSQHLPALQTLQF